MNRKVLAFASSAILITTMLACSTGAVFATPTPLAMLTSTATVTPTQIPPTLTPTPGYSDCFTPETLAYQKGIFKILGEFDTWYKKTESDLKGKNTPAVLEDSADAQSLINQLNSLKPTSLVRQYHELFVQAMEQYRDGLKDLASGEVNIGITELTNGDALFNKRTAEANKIDALCYPTLSPTGPSG